MAVDDAYTVSLLHFDGNLTDESGKVWTAHGGAATSTAQSKFGIGSLLGGYGKYISTPATTDFNFGAGDFTVDWWELLTGSGVTMGSPVFNVQSESTITSGSDSYSGSVGVGWTESGNRRLFLSSTGKSWDVANCVSMGNPIYNSLTHYVFSRKGNNFYTFQNGILISTFSSTASIYYNPNYLVTVGARGGLYLDGYVDELRASKGIARWTANFTPPTAPYGLRAFPQAMTGGM
ncbi:MAG: LamG-like jellyroll fold domain-containing protein [Anaeromusa sp.]|uniref:LamG-like jellyroll fold domain-containing protein n=1 Tax=Anaeromusa sp. TaxID=1872520 RepID=UPI002B214E29|nr:LamG-like jellyroll fold domain-containing protein [Anaeromusa sp.]MEA4835380.1 LamG-like jellyroll fold domain-containing protein [Anaeromusa sp.]